jgi:hypothetical protein
MRQRIFEVGLAMVVAMAVVVGSAGAGQYHVYSCRMPDGEAAPVDGWVGSTKGTFTYAMNTCGAPNGALVAALGDQPPRESNADMATWAFSPPPGATLAGATVWRAGDADGGAALNATFRIWLAGPLNFDDAANAFSQCASGSSCPVGIGNSTSPLAPENRVIVAPANLGGRLFAVATCSGESGLECPERKGDPANYAAVIYLYAADLTLEQTAGPSASGTGGELTTAPTIAGTSDVTFNASDPGAGVYEAIFTVDGKVVQSTVIDEEGGRCRSVGQTTDELPAFLYLQPCPSSVSADVGFDTTRVANGAHHLVVSVIDAAGNSAPVLDKNVNVQNPGAPGPPNGLGASVQASLTARWGSTVSSTLRTTFRRREAIHGRLTDASGKPISGALIDVSATPSFTGGKTISMKAVHTALDGRFVLWVPPGVSSRTIRLAYRAHLGDPRPVASKVLKLSVSASLSLQISPRTASAGSTIRFTGRLRGGPIPHGGKPLVLEARSGGAWIEFDVIRSDRHGRYHAGYTFKFPGPARYQFRVLCEAEADYPFAAGSSPVVGVTEH